MAHILLIDDDRNLREVVGYMLEEAGHQVTRPLRAQPGSA